MDLNLQLALVAALGAAKLVKVPAFKAGPRSVYDAKLAKRLAATRLPDDGLAKVRSISWPDERMMFAIWPRFDGETDEFAIADLRGLERCTSLERLSIDDQGSGKVTSLAPLRALTKLRSLRLGGPIEDLRPLAKLTKLEELSLEGIAAKDVAPLLALPALKTLRLSWKYRAPGPTSADAQALVDALAARAVAVRATFPCGPIQASAPVTRSARNPKLEAAIRADPDDEQAYLVYADWLQAEGDPRGELIVMDHQLARRKSAKLVEARRAHFVRHKEHLLGGAADATYEWRLGFIREARSFNGPKDVAALLSSTAGRFVADLGIYLSPGEEPALVKELLAAKPPLRALELTQHADEPLDLTKLWKTFPALRVLHLELNNLDATIKLGTIELPEVRTVKVRGWFYEQAALVQSLVTARWPRLEELDVQGWAPDLTPLLVGRDLGSLRRLRLFASGSFTDELCSAVAKAKIVDQLDELTIHGVEMTSAGLAALVAAKARFAHLKKLTLDFHTEELTPAEHKAFKELRSRRG